MPERPKKAINAILEDVNPSRRKFLQRALIAGGAITLAAPGSVLLAQGKGGGVGKGGKGKGKGGGKGKGKGGPI